MFGTDLSDLQPYSPAYLASRACEALPGAAAAGWDRKRRSAATALAAQAILALTQLGGQEARVITGPETTAALNLGEGIRTSPGGTPYGVATPTSR